MYAGGKSRGAEYQQENLMVIDLTGTICGLTNDIEALDAVATANFPNVVRALPKGAKDTNSGILQFYIPDMQIPKFDVKYWDLLVEDVQNLLLRSVDVLAMCQGGHGRTGIAIAILCYKIAPHVTGDDPIGWAREAYCPKIVETEEQIQYIYDVLELGTAPTSIKPSKTPFLAPFYQMGHGVMIYPLQGGGKQSKPKNNWWQETLSEF